jgi:hypothetical protein
MLLHLSIMVNVFRNIQIHAVTFVNYFLAVAKETKHL